MTTPEGSWHETFAPKLIPELIKRMKDDFKRFYPSEILNQDTMPSVRLLSLIYDQISKKNWMWVPWKYRLSQAKSEEIKSQRVSKLPKIEGLALHELLIDERIQEWVSMASGPCWSCRTLALLFVKEHILVTFEPSVTSFCLTLQYGWMEISASVVRMCLNLKVLIKPSGPPWRI